MHKLMLIIFIINIIINYTICGPLYQLEQLTPNPGIYFERLQEIRIRRADWKVHIYINVDDFMQNHAPLSSYKTVLDRCLQRIEERKCRNALTTDLIEVKQENLRKLQEHINETLKSLGHIEHPTVKNPRSIRTKRLAPLGIVGTISKSLFGLVTTDDAQCAQTGIARSK